MVGVLNLGPFCCRLPNVPSRTRRLSLQDLETQFICCVFSWTAHWQMTILQGPHM